MKRPLLPRSRTTKLKRGTRHPLTKLARRFPHKRAFITGAGSGLGLELARALARDGWALGLFDRNVERLAAVEADLSGRGLSLTAYPGDVTHANELTVAVNSFAAGNNGLDLIINNAGVVACGTLMEVSTEDWRWSIDVDLMGTVHGCRAAIPHLQRNGRGLIINVASAAAFAAVPGTISHNAAKAAVLALSETLRQELRSIGIQVSVAMPALFPTNLLESARGPAGRRDLAARLMRSSHYHAADAAHDILARAAAGGAYIVLPRSMQRWWWMKRWMPELFLRRVHRRREALHPYVERPVRFDARDERP
ncbi:SDR family oxidoreductase [Steroidobacter denitrificans]|uniref:SDR family oxidoreductase n=1 Tax=Steroidobacter denitrificans TaxID=465721 RepID=A0A127FCR2_STEDE|nr:SDR family NAD(P)-dependent oxidoreductase [Steroidobacter denitrificans]AMN48187.1 SDR family oxidoreductase [Steroidobacter denitrificans]